MHPQIKINPEFSDLEPFLRSLPEVFPSKGRMIHRGRNEIRVFEVGGVELNVKRFARPSFPNKFIYGLVRKPKCCRAYDYALKLNAMGFSSPTPVAWLTERTRGALGDSYLCTIQSHDLHFTDACNRFPAGDSLAVVEAFVRFAMRLHDAGIEHKDFNHSNILYRPLAEGGYAFSLVDINRMEVHRHSLSKRLCVINLRRLFCPAVPFLHILKCYADNRGWDHDELLLRGIFLRLGFSRFKEQKHRLVARLSNLFSHEERK